MAKQIKRIGVLTSGGDAPGMNAVVRAVVRTTAAYGISCLGIRRGYRGLINGDIVELGARRVDGIISKGGTMLYTARCLEMLTEEGLQQAADNAQYMGLDGLIVCGGDGSFRGAQALSRKGIPAIGVPGTIDNDIVCSDYTIGFDSACNTAIQAVDKLRDTMQWDAVQVIWRWMSVLPAVQQPFCCRSASWTLRNLLSRRCVPIVFAAESIILSSWQKVSAMHRTLRIEFTRQPALTRV